MKEKTASTVDSEEVERFSRMASEWWNPSGKFKPLHRINPLRIQLIRDHICQNYTKDPENPKPLSGIHMLDIGCGGGLISEPMHRMGANVTAVDASEQNIHIAKLHAKEHNLTIDYRHSTAETLAEDKEQFDVVLALEIVEHVSDAPLFLSTLCQLVKPGGLIFCSTLNRTMKSYALAIVGAEYFLRWVPVGTHQWSKFLRPSELCHPLRQHDINIIKMTGMVLNPINNQWRWDDRDLSVNYIVIGKKPL